MKIRFVVYSKHNGKLTTQFYDSEFNPIENINKMLSLFLDNPEQTNTTLLDPNENYCLIDKSKKSYCWIKTLPVIKKLSVYSTKSWLKLHYPQEQFFNEEGSQDEIIKTLKTLIYKSDKYDLMYDKKFDEYLRLAGIVF